MNKKIRKCMVFVLSVSAVTTGPFMASGSIRKATPSTAEPREESTDMEEPLKADSFTEELQEANTQVKNSRETGTSSQDKVLHLSLPTDTEHVFDFIMDPEGLIGKTEAAAYGGSLFEEEANLFFKRSDGRSEMDYSSSSDALTIVNQAPGEVRVVLTAHVSPDSVSGIVMTEDSEFTDDARPSLYLALTDGEQTVPIDLTEGACIDTVMEEEYSFWLTGAVNRDGDWSEVKDITPVVTVTWKVSTLDEKEEEAEEVEYSENFGSSEKVATPSQLQ